MTSRFNEASVEVARQNVILQYEDRDPIRDPANGVDRCARIQQVGNAMHCSSVGMAMLFSLTQIDLVRDYRVILLVTVAAPCLWVLSEAPAKVLKIKI